MDDLLLLPGQLLRRVLIRRLSPRLPSDSLAGFPNESSQPLSGLPSRIAHQDCLSGMPFRIALQDCLSGVLFGIGALPDCVSSLPFRIALQDCLSGLPFRIGLQECRLGFPFRIAIQDCLFNFVLEGLKRVPCRDLKSTISVNIFFYGSPLHPQVQS